MVAFTASHQPYALLFTGMS